MADYDFSFQPKTRNATLDDSFNTELCAFHAKQRQDKEKLRKKEKKKGKGCCTSICNRPRMLGKSSLQRKLMSYNIKNLRIKATRSHKVSAIIGDSDSNDDKLLTATELGYLNESQLDDIIRVFDEKITSHEKELVELTEERDRFIDDGHGLTLTMKRLQEVMLREMKPWVNLLPECNELTRAMLLN